jgi:hypothetical protein
MSRKWTAIACVASCCLVLLNLWDNRDLFDPEGITYLDMADAYRRGEWREALVGLWSPLYPGLIALMLLAFDPAAQWEFAAVHALNFVIYLLALASFSVFMREFLRARSETIPDWAWIALGYGLFTWSVIRLIPLHQPEPDLLVCAWVYLICALLFRIRGGELTWARAILFGAVLALGYLTKAVMFPMAFVFTAVALALALRSPGAWHKVAAGFAVFVLLSAPYAFVLSEANGRWMYSDAGRLNYMWHVNQVERWSHWQGDGVHGTPVHATRKIHDEPPMYEFGTPFRATYPPWYNPSYWYEGVELRLDLAREAAVFVANAKRLFYFLASSPGSVTSWGLYAELDGKDRTVGPLATLFCLMIVAALFTRVSVWRRIAAHWFLLLPIAAVFGAYAVLHVEGRFFAAYVVVLWLVLFRAVALPRSPESATMVSAALACAGLITVATLASETGRAVAHMARFPASGGSQAAFFQSGYPSWKVASYLREAGLRPGDPVGSVGWTYSAYWARMARVHIVAEVPSAYDGAIASWFSAEEKRAAVMRRFEDLGVKAVVAKHVPAGSAPASWRPIADTDYHVHVLPQSRLASVE